MWERGKRCTSSEGMEAYVGGDCLARGSQQMSVSGRGLTYHRALIRIPVRMTSSHADGPLRRCRSGWCGCTRTRQRGSLKTSSACPPVPKPMIARGRVGGGADLQFQSNSLAKRAPLRQATGSDSLDLRTRERLSLPKTRGTRAFRGLGRHWGLQSRLGRSRDESVPGMDKMDRRSLRWRRGYCPPYNLPGRPAPFAPTPG